MPLMGCSVAPLLRLPLVSSTFPGAVVASVYTNYSGGGGGDCWLEAVSVRCVTLAYKSLGWVLPLATLHNILCCLLLRSCSFTWYCANNEVMLQWSHWQNTLYIIPMLCIRIPVFANVCNSHMYSELNITDFSSACFQVICLGLQSQSPKIKFSNQYPEGSSTNRLVFKALPRCKVPSSLVRSKSLRAKCNLPLSKHT